MTDIPRDAIVQSYRNLYRHGLRAVRYSSPARFVLRDRLRRAFRDSPISAYEQRRIDNTVLFFKAAAQDRGLEHRLLKSLCHVWFLEAQHWRRRDVRLRQIGTLKGDVRLQSTMAVHQAYDQFYFTLKMLNETMGLCLR
jgi:hypothetical protein